MPFRRIAIVWSELSGDMTQLARRLAAVLQAEGVRVILEANAVGPGAPENCDVLDMASICRTCDLAIIVGNDRTVLRYAPGWPPKIPHPWPPQTPPPELIGRGL